MLLSLGGYLNLVVSNVVGHLASFTLFGASFSSP